ncbi:MAG: small, acid-soluble spore protein, alpha/beta type [Chitinophagales bacterium]
MSRNRAGMMSEQLKYELAKEMGVDQIVASEGWGGVSSRDCGNLVKMAIKKAEESLSQNVSRPKA